MEYIFIEHMFDVLNSDTIFYKFGQTFNSWV